MANSIYERIEQAPIQIGNFFEISIEQNDQEKELFNSIGTTLNFDLIPSKSWDAFIDQFREFCAKQKEDTILVFEGYVDFKNCSPFIASKLVEVLGFVINEHREIVTKNLYIRERDRFHANHDILICVVLNPN